MVAEMASSQGNNGAKKIHGHGPTTEGRNANIAMRQRLVIQAPRPLATTTVRQAVAAHAEMLAGIRRHFESSGE